MEESPSRLRIKQLGDRLLNLQYGLEDERQSRAEIFQSKLKNLESRVQNSSISTEAKFKLLKDQITKLGETMASERVARELLDERKTKELKLVENNLNIDLNILKQSRKEHEGKVIKSLDEKLYALRLELAKEKKFREEVAETQSQCIEENLSRLTSFVENEAVTREESCTRLNQHVQEEIVKIEDSIQIERKEREEVNNSMMKMLDDMQERLLQEISFERQERQSTEETLLKLLEETCLRVENALRGAAY
jgi:hypothetical protein